MNKNQISEDNMCAAVLKIMYEYNTAIANNQPILDEITVIEGFRTNIDYYAQIQQETTKGATIEEHLSRVDAANKGEKWCLG